MSRIATIPEDQPQWDNLEFQDTATLQLCKHERLKNRSFRLTGLSLVPGAPFTLPA